MAVQHGVARDANGGVIAEATVTVYLAGTTTPATLYEDETLAATAPNPTTANSVGEWVLYIDPGIYDIQIAKPGYTTSTLENVEISGVGSAAGPYGEAYVSASAALSATSSFATVPGTFASGELNYFTRSSGVLTYTGADTRKFAVMVSFSVQSDTGSVTVETSLRLNGTGNIAKSEIQRKMSATPGDIAAGSMSCLIELSTDDTIECVARVLSGTPDLTFEKLNMSLVG